MTPVRLRPATLADAATLAHWDTKPHVIAATTDDPAATRAFGDIDWAKEIAAASPVSHHLIADLDGRAIGAMQIIDPQLEETHYWGEIGCGHRALDIWIGEEDALGKGHGETMMRLAFQRCFADQAVVAIIIDPLASNLRAHKFYRRLGFTPEGLRRFGEDGEDLCLVHRLTRAAWSARFPADGGRQPSL